jgi:DNA polymerase
MHATVLCHVVDLAGWRKAARALALHGIPPEQTVWSVGAGDDLFADGGATADIAGTFTVPRGILDMAETVIQANDPARFALLYALVWRAHRGEKQILHDAADPLVQRVVRLAQAVRRDTHKMRAFLRFREVTAADNTRYVAWFEPSHFIVEANAAFFVRRFATMRWSILTPYRSVHWNGAETVFGPGADPADVPDDDRLAAYWRAYFSSIFNPARLKVAAMTSEMPKKYWRNMPEAAAIPELIRGAPERARRMVEAPVLSPARPVPPKALTMHVAPTPPADNVAACRRCGLWQAATQAVWGEGPTDARLMLVGEQPGVQEDLTGRPFVGPAGKLLDRALVAAGIARDTVYVTNAVKHFKFEPRGKRRIHQSPDAGEIQACRFWLDQERALVRPAVTLLLGASAARAVLGRAVTISRERGAPIALDGGTAFVTVHPSYLLRLPDEAARDAAYDQFVTDLRLAAGWLVDPTRKEERSFF